MNIENVRKSLVDFMEQTGTKQAKVAKEMGLSATTISQFLSGVYTGNNEDIAKAVEGYLDIATARLKNKNATLFYEGLRNTQISMFGATYAHKNCEIVLLSGDAGAGKTTALEYYTSSHSGVIFVTADVCTSSATAILTEIAGAMGKSVSGTKSRIMKTLIDSLTGTNRLIIIDEADQLTFSALQAIRKLNDKAKVGILLAGNNKIYNQMVMGAKCTEFDQIRTRIFVRPKVSNEYTIDEVSHIFPNTEDDALRTLLKIAERESLRTAIKLFNVIAEMGIAGGGKVKAKDIKAVQMQFLGETA